MKTIQVIQGNKEIMKEGYTGQVTNVESSKEYMDQAISFLEESTAKLSVARTIFAFL